MNLIRLIVNIFVAPFFKKARGTTNFSNVLSLKYIYHSNLLLNEQNIRKISCLKQEAV